MVTDPRRQTLDGVPSLLPEPYQRHPYWLVFTPLLRLPPVLGTCLGASGPRLKPQVVREPRHLPFVRQPVQGAKQRGRSSLGLNPWVLCEALSGGPLGVRQQLLG